MLTAFFVDKFLTSGISAAKNQPPYDKETIMSSESLLTASDRCDLSAEETEIDSERCGWMQQINVCVMVVVKILHFLSPF